MNKIAYELGRKYAAKMDISSEGPTVAALAAYPWLAGLGAGILEPDYPIRTGLGTTAGSLLGGLGGAFGGGYLGKEMGVDDVHSALSGAALGELLGTYAGSNLLPKYLKAKKTPTNVVVKKENKKEKSK